MAADKELSALAPLDDLQPTDLLVVSRPGAESMSVTAADLAAKLTPMMPVASATQSGLMRAGDFASALIYRGHAIGSMNNLATGIWTIATINGVATDAPAGAEYGTCICVVSTDNGLDTQLFWGNLGIVSFRWRYSGGTWAAWLM